MVNVTYDACRPTPSSRDLTQRSPPSTAGDLLWSANGQSGVYNLGNIAWTLASTALVWIMIPGVGFFYSGLLRRKNALSMIYLSMMCVAVVSFQVCSYFYTTSYPPLHLA